VINYVPRHKDVSIA